MLKLFGTKQGLGVFGENQPQNRGKQKSELSVFDILLHRSGVGSSEP